MKEQVEKMQNNDCYQGIEGGHDFLESGDDQLTCVYCNTTVKIKNNGNSKSKTNLYDR